ncbi:MAG: hypothetical protein A2Y25_07135 [Candidatus Melainabacteria bacterium GWF2_37_15]|nr:MAG: hypothetical protein A2Y25_07135 [Candidatus Melainabacteria bacterium GWF2_37_15]
MLINYDKNSLIIDNQRVLIKSAAIHYFRIPGENVWRDRLSKLKACGYNAVDIYFCWAYHSKEPGVYDFTGIRDIRALLDIAAELGLFVIARPGPYINAELSLGGLPPWLLNQPDIHLRNRKDGDFVYSEIYMKYLREWYSRIIPILNEYHNIIAFQIENEYFTNEAEPDYMQELYDMARSMGIKAPIFHNDVLGVGLYSDIVNIYAFDTYPTVNMLFDWRDFPDSFGVLDNAEENLKIYCENSPLFVAELQAGWYDRWNGPGYRHIRRLFGREHINIVTKTALSQGITMFNHYMGCGGTSWDKLASCEVYTSYDFAAPVSDVGIPKGNGYKAKEINYFLNAFNLASTDPDTVDIEGENVFAKLRKDNINGCKWLFIRNLNREAKKFNLWGHHKLCVNPFDMKILPLNLQLKGCTIEFSGMSIFGRVENGDKETILILIEKNNQIKITEGENKSIFRGDDLEDLSRYHFGNTEVIFIKEATADKTWIVDNKIVFGADFLTDNLQKAAVYCNEEVKLPQLSEWKCFNASPEIDMMYDYSGWNYAREDKPDCISNEIYDDYIWYKGSFTGHIDSIEIDAKHCYAIYVNGKQIFYHDCTKCVEGSEVEEIISFNIDKHIFEKGLKNEITILVQNMGFDRGFQNELQNPRGLISFKTFPEKDIKWQLRGGLTPVIEEWTEARPQDIESESENPRLILLKSDFELHKNNNIYNPLLLDMSNFPYEKADVYLNGNLIGRYWKNKSQQDTFYLMDGFLEEKNSLCLIIWDMKPENFVQKGCENIERYVKIKIRNIKSYKLIPVSELY